MGAAPDLYRWVSLAEAAKRLPMADPRARALLREAKLVRWIDGRECVWLEDLVKLGQETRKASTPSKTRSQKPGRRADEPRDEDLLP